MLNNRVGKVYIIGAGCGNIDLLTLKGKRCIEEADCVIYDRLIDSKVLKLAKFLSGRVKYLRCAITRVFHFCSAITCIAPMDGSRQIVPRSYK